MALSRRNKIPGFTIVELMLVMALFAIISSLVYFGWNSIQAYGQEMMRDFEEEIEYTQFLSLLNKEINQADSIQSKEKEVLYFHQGLEARIIFEDAQMIWEKQNLRESFEFDSCQWVCTKINSNFQSLDLTIYSNRRANRSFIYHRKGNHEN